MRGSQTLIRRAAQRLRPFGPARAGKCFLKVLAFKISAYLVPSRPATRAPHSSLAGQPDLDVISHDLGSGRGGPHVLSPETRPHTPYIYMNIPRCVTHISPLRPPTPLLISSGGRGADVTKFIRGYVTVNLCECPRMSAYRRISNPRICAYPCDL